MYALMTRDFGVTDAGAEFAVCYLSSVCRSLWVIVRMLRREQVRGRPFRF